MFALLCIIGAAKKYEVEVNVKYTSACPGVAESLISIDGEEAFTPPKYDTAKLRIAKGKHVIHVTHPWCTFYPVYLDLEDEHHFIAKMNTSTTTTQPISIKHQPNVAEEDMLLGMFKSPMMLGLLAVPLLSFLCKKYLSKPEVQEKIIKMQQDMQQQQQALKEQQAAAK